MITLKAPAKGLVTGLFALTVALTTGACSASVSGGGGGSSGRSNSNGPTTVISHSNGPSGHHNIPTDPGRSGSHDFPPGSTTPNSDGPDSAPPSGSGPSSVADRATAIHTLTPRVGSDEDLDVVRVPSGYDGIIFDNTGHLLFFHSSDGRQWDPDGTSSYRYDPRDAAGQRISEEGRLLENMSHATFLLRGTFTGDGSGLWMAFAKGKSGWGPVVRDPADGGVWLRVADRLPSIESNDQVSYHSLIFKKGYLVEQDCYPDEQNANCGAPGTMYTAWWHWDRDEQAFRSA